MKNKIAILCCLFLTNIAAKPPSLLNFGSSCYVNAIIQSLYAAQPLVTIMPTLEFETRFARDFQQLITALEEKRAITTSLFNFYKTLVTTFVQPGAVPPIEEASFEESGLEGWEAQKKAYEELRQYRFPGEKEAIRESLKTHREETRQARALAQEIGEATGQPVNYVKRLLKQIGDATQQDAHEFLTQLIDNLRGNDTNSKTYQDIQDLFFYVSAAIKKEAGRLPQQIIEKPNSILLLPAYKERSELITKGEAEQKKYYYYYTPFTSLQDGFDAYFAEEKLGNGTLKKSYLETIPPIFTLALNRAYYDRNASQQKKVTSAITIPLAVDFAPYVSNDYTNHTAYSLFAVITHRGSPTSGHYIAYVKVKEDDYYQWYECNDKVITRKNAKQLTDAINEDGYILFYQREDEIPLRAPEVVIVEEKPLQKPEVKIIPKKTIIEPSKKIPTQCPDIISQAPITVREEKEKQAVRTPARPLQQPTKPPLRPAKKVLTQKEEQHLLQLLESTRSSLRKLLSLLQ